MPFLKHGASGDCDGQPDDERADDEAHGVSSAWIHARTKGSASKGSLRTLNAINKNADGIGRTPHSKSGSDAHQKRQVFDTVLRDRLHKEYKQEDHGVSSDWIEKKVRSGAKKLPANSASVSRLQDMADRLGWDADDETTAGKKRAVAENILNSAARTKKVEAANSKVKGSSTYPQKKPPKR